MNWTMNNTQFSLLFIYFLLFDLSTVSAFTSLSQRQASCQRSSTSPTTRSSTRPTIRSAGTTTTTTYNRNTRLHEKEKRKGDIDPGLKNKLISESIAPWRTVRLFLYGSLGSGAMVGGLITLSGALAAFSGARTDLDLNTELTNLAIDFGAVAIFVVLAKWDFDKQQELNEKVSEKFERKREQTKLASAMKEREKEIGELTLDLTVNAEGATKEAPVKELQAGAKQHMIIVIGPKRACKDALIGANLLKMDFAMSNILVVPFEIDKGAIDSRPTQGFGERPMYETQAYVARPGPTTAEAWEKYAKAEMDDAVAQNGDGILKEGIVVVVASNGKVIRRGVGKVPWRQMVEQLEEAVKVEK